MLWKFLADFSDIFSLWQFGTFYLKYSSLIIEQKDYQYSHNLFGIIIEINNITLKIFIFGYNIICILNCSFYKMIS